MNDSVHLIVRFLATWKVFVYMPEVENRQWAPRPLYRYLYGRSYTARLWYANVVVTNAKFLKSNAPLRLSGSDSLQRIVGILWKRKRRKKL